LTWSKWFYSLVSFDTRCHSYFNFFNERSLIINLTKFVCYFGYFSGCKYKTLFTSYKRFSSFIFKKKQNKC
jgi:hypothetical protein